MKKLAMALLAMFVCFSVVGCGTTKNRPELLILSSVEFFEGDNIISINNAIAEILEEFGYVKTKSFIHGKEFTKEYKVGDSEYICTLDVVFLLDTISVGSEKNMTPTFVVRLQKASGGFNFRYVSDTKDIGFREIKRDVEFLIYMLEGRVKLGES